MIQPSTYSSSFLSTLWTLVVVFASLGTGIFMWHNVQWVLNSFSLPSFLAIPLEYQAEAPIIRTLAAVLAGFLVFFLLAYVFKAMVDALRVFLVGRSLQEAARTGLLSDPERHPGSQQWSFYPRFSHLWREYTQTLHLQRLRDKSGKKWVAYRASVPAESFFGTQYLVDIPMRVEFFRHLPGILTGTGIVSTFAGILLGLTEFNPTVEPEQVTHQLKALFTGVSTAFVASFFAIFAAILVTVVEKLLLHWRYTQVAFLHSLVDELFKGGVESEYLAALVRSGQEHSRQLATVSRGVMPQMQALLEQGGPTAGAPGPEGTMDQAVNALGERLVTAKGGLAQEVRRAVETSLEGLTEPLERISQTLVALHRDREEGQQMARTMESLAGKIGQHLEGNPDKLAGHVGGLREELAGDRRELERMFERLLALVESQSARGDVVTGRMDQGLEQRASINAGVSSLREEVVRQGEKAAAMGERSNTLLVEEVRRLLNELTRLQQDAAKERDAFLMASFVQSQGELADKVKEAFDLGLEKPAQEIVSSVQGSLQEMREAQTQQNRALSEQLLEAFAAQLRQSVERLVEKLAEMGDLISSEREAMEATFRGLAEVSREGGEDLSRQMEKAMAWAETRQDGMLDALTKFTADMRVDIDLLQDRVRQAGKEVSGQVVAQTRDMVEKGATQAGNRLDEASGRMKDEVGALKATLHALTRERIGRDAQRDTLLNHRLQSGNEQVMDRLQTLFQENLDRESQREERLLGRLADSGEKAVEQVRDSFQEGLEASTELVTKSVQETGDRQERRSRDLADMMMATIASKVENTFGGLADGLNDLRQRFTSERDAIRSTLQVWVDDLAKTNQTEAQALAQSIRQVLADMEYRHEGMMGALAGFGTSLSGEMEGMRDGLLENSEKNARELTQHMDEVVTTVGHEQAVFIEMMGERLETLRKRLKVK